MTVFEMGEELRQRSGAIGLVQGLPVLERLDPAVWKECCKVLAPIEIMTAEHITESGEREELWTRRLSESKMGDKEQGNRSHFKSSRVDRLALVKALVSGLEPGTLQFNHKAERVTESTDPNRVRNGVTIEFATPRDGVTPRPKPQSFDFVVGADGIHSRVGKQTELFECALTQRILCV